MDGDWRGVLPSTQSVDVFVVGAGPAGLACAIAAAQRGLRVRVVDAAREGPVDKACGEGLLPDAVEALCGLGVRLRRGQEIAGIRFHGCGRVAEARFRAETGMGVRRTELHRAMLERVAELGIRVEWGTALRGNGREVEEIQGRWIVGADGGQSRVRAAARLEGRVTTRRIGLRQHFKVAPWSECVEVFWAEGAQAYVTPVGNDEVGVAFLSRQRFADVGQALELFPGLRDRLHGAAAASLPRGGATVTRRLRRVTDGRRVALLGDASGSVDAITGEGLNLCFRQADALVEAMLTGDLREYEAAHRRILRIPRIMAGALLRMDRSPLLRAGAMAVLAEVPGVFAGLLGLHVGAGARGNAEIPKLGPISHLSR
jgi:flavin-dependent dehydrogenase